MSSPSPFQPQTNTISLPPISALLSMAEADRSTSNTPHQHTRRSTHSHNGFIDLTRDSPSSPSTSLTGTPSHSRNSKEPPEKRRRIGGEGSGSRRILFEPPPLDPSNYPRHNDNIILLDDVEEVDLTEVGGERGLRKIQEDQRKRHEKLQEQQNHLLKDSVQAQESEKDGPVKLSKITCVICMENMTNITATHCGHLFCHTCIMEALIAGETGEPGKPQSRCPVCRMKVVRNPKSSATPQVIPLEIKLLAKSAIAKGKEKVKVV